jgi:hypothetical protein
MILSLSELLFLDRGAGPRAGCACGRSTLAAFAPRRGALCVGGGRGLRVSYTGMRQAYGLQWTNHLVNPGRVPWAGINEAVGLCEIHSQNIPKFNDLVRINLGPGFGNAPRTIPDPNAKGVVHTRPGATPWDGNTPTTISDLNANGVVHISPGATPRDGNTQQRFSEALKGRLSSKTKVAPAGFYCPFKATRCFAVPDPRR